MKTRQTGPRHDFARLSGMLSEERDDGLASRLHAAPAIPRKTLDAPLFCCLREWFGSATIGQSRQDLFCEWDAWAREPGSHSEDRANAVERLQQWAAGKRGDALCLSHLGLASLPVTLPAGLKHLDISHNEFTALPERLPAGIQKLEADHNRLSSLPTTLPGSLRSLHVSGNRLTSLPDRLPSGLKELFISDNLLSCLPERLPDGLNDIFARQNRLKALPDHLPSALSRINISHNQMKNLPESIPASIKHLNINANRLVNLPEKLPSALQELGVDDNLLTRLPERLPAGLKDLLVASNRLSRLPNHLPCGLTRIHAPNNRLTTLPESLFHIRQDANVCLENNPFPEQLLTKLAEVLNTAGYHGPRIHFSMAEAGDPPPVELLGDVVAAWHEEGAAQAQQKWSVFEKEDGAAQFSQFLNRLRRTVNYASPAFKQAVLTWLAELATKPDLRSRIFLISADALASCEDRVSLAFNDMKKAQIANDVEEGQYDHRLPELVTLARQMFRLDALENIARKKAESLRFVDEIEVYLAYQVMLHDALALPLDAREMRHFGASHVTQNDVDEALAEVKQAEAAGFNSYLSSTWMPWQSMLQRQAGSAYATAREEIVDAMGAQFTERLASRLSGTGLERDLDAMRNAGAQIRVEIANEINEKLTRRFLNEEGLLHLLDRQVWPDCDAMSHPSREGDRGNEQDRFMGPSAH
jgi:hypothetical protein